MNMSNGLLKSPRASSNFRGDITAAENNITSVLALNSYCEVNEELSN
jgi:hypothetical protein